MGTGSSLKISIAVFLGNPGIEYRDTRHNFAWRVLEKLMPPPTGWKKRFQGEFTRYAAHDASAYLLRPLTLMNRSGHSVGAMAHFFRIPPDEILVIHDDLELDFGWVAYKHGGGLGGHNGLRSVADTLGTRDFQRLRLGISRPGRGSVTSWVLGRFSKHEMPGLDAVAEAGAESLMRLLNSPGRGDPFRRKVFPPPES